MTDRFYMLDGRHVWWEQAFVAAREFGFIGHRVWKVDSGMRAGDVGFVRPTAAPGKLEAQRKVYAEMAAQGLRMVQDSWNVQTYDDKVAQLTRLKQWLPATWLFRSRRHALAFITTRNAWPLVSKAACGASSSNVRILADRRLARRHVDELFGRGVWAWHSAEGKKSRQKGYAYLQQHIPHDVTWRVNVMGAGRAVFRRFNHPQKGTAQTGNVEGVKEMTDEVASVLDFADQVAENLGTGWCALDILRHGSSWRLLETSLAWPTKPNEHGDVPIFRTPYLWGDLWRSMFNEIRAGRLAGSLPST